MNGLNGQKKDEPTTFRTLKGPLIASAIFHLVIIVLMIVGLPYIRREHKIPEMISVELATVADKTQTDKPPVTTPKPAEEKKEEPKPTPPKPAPVKEPPKKEPAKPAPDKKPVEVKKETPDQDELAPPKKTPDKKPEKKPEPKKEEPKKEESAELDSLLKNLTKDEPAPKTDITDITKKLTDAPPQPSPDTPTLGEQLTMSDIDALRQQLAGCWNVFAGAAEAQDLSVDIRVIVNADRTVQNAGIMDQSRYNSDDRYRAAADSALRAVRDPRCSPLNLPPEKYNLWHDMIVNFDPKDML